MFCPKCGNEYVAQANLCSSCGTSLAGAPYLPNRPQIVRPCYPRMIAGVCSGVALHYGWDAALVRIVVVAFTVFTGGLGILVYIAAWIIIPDALYTLPPGTQQQTPVERVG